MSEQIIAKLRSAAEDIHPNAEHIEVGYVRETDTFFLRVDLPGEMHWSPAISIVGGEMINPIAPDLSPGKIPSEMARSADFKRLLSLE